jgi:hypothetical protein
VVLATGTQGGTIGSGIRPPFSLVPRDPGHESGIYGEEVKLEGKVSDEYFEAYVDAHDEGERVEGLVMSRLGLARLGSAYIGLSKNRQAKPSQAMNNGWQAA